MRLLSSSNIYLSNRGRMWSRYAIPRWVALSPSASSYLQEGEKMLTEFIFTNHNYCMNCAQTLLMGTIHLQRWVNKCTRFNTWRKPSRTYSESAGVLRDASISSFATANTRNENTWELQNMKLDIIYKWKAISVSAWACAQLCIVFCVRVRVTRVLSPGVSWQSPSRTHAAQ